MKVIYILLLCLLSLFANADNVKTIDLSFDVKDFNMVRDERGLLEISSTKYLVSYGDDVTEPGLPLIGIKVAIPNGSEFQSLSMTGSKKVLQTNVLIKSNPLPEPTNAVPSPSTSTIPNYINKVYPDNTVRYVSTNTMDGYRMICFLVSPFEYDATKGELCFYENISIQINLANSKSASFCSSPFVGKNAKHWIKQLVINPEDVEDLTPSGASPKIMTSLSPTGPVDYLIITADSLVSSFDELVEWKRTKGIRTEVISIDSIDQNYSNSTIQLKIKHCLYDNYTNRGLRYVLLGGDDTIVPVQYCYAKVNTPITNMPSDLYYACFGDSLNWDGNGNGIYGEVADSIDFSPSIYISRLPIRTQEHVSAFLNKLICYEKNPLSKPWHNNILMAGARFGGNLIGEQQQSDAEAKADSLYDNYILPYWSGSRVKFFDTYTDFPGGKSYDLTTNHLQTQLQQGYTFMDMGTHGIQCRWELESYFSYYNTAASSLTNEGFTIIATVACLTNAFEHSSVNIPDPCLSEAFIRNPNSGVVAYLGCSREGWSQHGSNLLDGSYSYEKEYYKSLFNNSKRFHNYAEIVAMSKMQKINGCGSDGKDRWLQLGLNPLGDPEMPVYTQTPVEFDSCAISFIESGIAVNTGTDSCTICVMSTEDNGASYYNVRNYVSSAIFQGINQDVTVCITKHNYVPKIMEVRPVINIQNEHILDSRLYIADKVNIGSHVTDSIPIGNVVFESGTTKIKANSVRLMPGTRVNTGAQLKVINN